MKKKFVLTLALVLMVAATLVAATPLEVSGTFEAGYEFQFGNGAAAPAFADDSKAELVAEFTGDFWKVSLGTATYAAGEDDKVTAEAEIYLDKALAEEGVDMGDVSLTLHVGTGVSDEAPSVLADPMEWATGVETAAADQVFGLSIGYAELVDVYFAMFPDKDFAMVVGATVSPLEGVDVAVGFANKATNQLGASVAADIAALADLDFDLSVSAGYVIADLANITHEVNFDVAAEYAGVGLYAAYQLDAGKKHNIGAGLSYATTVEGFGLSAGVDLEVLDVTKFADNYEVTLSAGADYTLGGAKYALDLEYTLDKGNTQPFSLTPSVSISF